MYDTSQKGSFRPLRAGNLVRVQNKPSFMSLKWLLTSSHGDKAEWNWPKHSKWDKPPDELNEHTWMHAHRLAETDLKYPLSDYTDQQTKQKRNSLLWGSCTAPFLCTACLTPNGFWPVSCDTDSIANSAIHVIPQLRTHQLAAMEQLGIWQGRTCMFHTMFFISYKTSGRVKCNVSLDEEPFLLRYFYSLLKYNTEKQGEAAGEACCSVCLWSWLGTVGGFQSG